MFMAMDGNLQKKLKKILQANLLPPRVHTLDWPVVCRANSNSYKKITAYEAITIPLRICEQIF